MLYPQPMRYRDLLRPFHKRQRFLALDHVNIEVMAGQRVAFLGTNGAGKSTLLKLIGGLLYPSKGNIQVNGYDTVSHNLQARHSVGYVLNEERSFYWRLTGIENLRFFGALDNLQGKKLDERIGWLLHQVGLEKAAHKLVAYYSSGMKQRLAIARGLLNQPEVLILDEPTRALDPQAGEEIASLLSAQITMGTCKVLLIATHRFDEALSLCNQVCIMNEGSILAYYSMQEVQETYGNLRNFYTHILETSIHVLSQESASIY